MSEQQRQAIVDLLRSGPDPALLSVAELRSMIDQGGAVTKPPADAVLEPVHIGEMPAEWSATPDADPARALLYFHGGGFVFGSLISHRGVVTQLGALAGVRTLAIDYRLAPENRFPSPLEDALAGYRFLLEQGFDPKRIVLAGDSAGAGLVIATLIALRDSGTALPAAALCMSPWVDMSLQGESMDTREDFDVLVSRAQLTWSMDQFIDVEDRRSPTASPLRADLMGLPPVLIQVSSHETLLDDSTRLASRLASADVQVQLNVWPRMPHVWQLYADILDEGSDALRQAAAFVREHIG